MHTRVFLGERDPLLALDKARRIYDFLGDSFFDMSLTNPTPERVVAWLTRTLLDEDLLVEFDDPRDAMLFKLTFV